MKRIFYATTRASAEEKADKWWKEQVGVKQIRRTVVATGDEGPSLSDMGSWAVTIHYKRQEAD